MQCVCRPAATGSGNSLLIIKILSGRTDVMHCLASPLHLWKIRCYSAIISPCRLGNCSLVYPWTLSTCFPFRQNRIFISHTKLTPCHDADAWRWGIRPSGLSEKLPFLCNLTSSTLVYTSLSEKHSASFFVWRSTDYSNPNKEEILSFCTYQTLRSHISEESNTHSHRFKDHKCRRLECSCVCSELGQLTIGGSPAVSLHDGFLIIARVSSQSACTFQICETNFCRVS